MSPARFWKNRRGSVAPLAALSMIPLMTGIGAAIDYSRANAARTAFQNAHLGQPDHHDFQKIGTQLSKLRIAQ